MNRPPMEERTLAYYFDAINKARVVAHAHGYALGVHGSQTYDLDLIAAPWAEACGTPENLAKGIAIALEWFLHPSVTNKPHGRKAFLIYGPRHVHIDLSVMPKGQHAIL